MRFSLGMIVNWMIRCNIINDEDQELYLYAIHSFFMLLLPVIYAIIIGFITGNIIQGLVLIMPFMVLRKFSGGYHSKKLSSCIVGSFILLYACMKLSFCVKCDWKLVLITFIACVTLIIFSPIDNANRMIDDGERKKIKIGVVVVLLLLLGINFIFFLLHRYNYIVCCSIGIEMVAGLQIPCIIKSFKMTKKY